MKISVTKQFSTYEEITAPDGLTKEELYKWINDNIASYANVIPNIADIDIQVQWEGSKAFDNNNNELYNSNEENGDERLVF